MPIEHVPPKTPQGTRILVFSKEMSLNATTTSHLPKVAKILPNAIQQPSHKRNVEQLEANARPHEIGQIKRIKNAEAMYMSKKRANTQMLDNLLRDKLNKVATKECVRHSQVPNTSIE